MASYVALLIGVLLNATANILIKHSMLDFQNHPANLSFVKQAATHPILILGVACFGLALGAYSFALTRIELSLGYVVMSCLGLVIVSAASVLLFGEKVTTMKLIGMSFVLIGIAILAYQAK